MILDFLTLPHTLEEILDLEIIYRRKQKAPDAFFYWDDRWMIEMHINHLIAGGKIKRHNNYYSID